MPHPFHKYRWKSPERPVGGLLYLRISKWANACDGLSSSRHWTSRRQDCLQSAALSGTRLLAEPEALWRTVPVWSSKMGPSSFKMDRDEKEGRQAWEDLKTHSGRPEATDLPQFQWGNSENKTFHGPSQNPKTCDTHVAFITRINTTALLIGKATEVGSRSRGQGVRKPYFRLDIPHCG